MLCTFLCSWLATAGVDSVAFRAGRTAVTLLDILGNIKRGAIEDNGMAMVRDLGYWFRVQIFL